MCDKITRGRLFFDPIHYRRCDCGQVAIYNPENKQHVLHNEMWSEWRDSLSDFGEEIGRKIELMESKKG